jgi:hypothetical protein
MADSGSERTLSAGTRSSRDAARVGGGEEDLGENFITSKETRKALSMSQAVAGSNEEEVGEPEGDDVRDEDGDSAGEDDEEEDEEDDEEKDEEEEAGDDGEEDPSSRSNGGVGGILIAGERVAQTSGLVSSQQLGSLLDAEMAQRTPGSGSGSRSGSDSDLPFTFAVPKTYQGFRDLLRHRSVQQQALVFERMQVCNHPNLAATNGMHIQRMYELLLSHHDALVLEEERLQTSVPAHLAPVSTEPPRLGASLFPALDLVQRTLFELGASAI